MKKSHQLYKKQMEDGLTLTLSLIKSILTLILVLISSAPEKSA